ncbi:MAG: TrkH family potassium uptake protein, partial [Herbinix sp.]|nr:TrkH family potassium uptake protein [Herbinix sp.]
MNKLKSSMNNLRIISYYTGYIILIIAGLMAIPMITSFVFAEWNPLIDFIISSAAAIIVGTTLMLFGMKAKANNETIQWKQGFTIAALSWVLLMVLCALPYKLSGNIGSMLDA